MKKSHLSLLLFTFVCLLSNCGKKNKETNSAQSSTQGIKSQELENSHVDEDSLLGKKFVYGINHNLCDGATYSEYQIVIFFLSNDKFEIIYSAYQSGMPSGIQHRETYEGKYSQKRKEVLLHLTKGESTKIATYFDAQNGKPLRNDTLQSIKKSLDEKINLKIDICPDGRLNLKSKDLESFLNINRERKFNASWSLSDWIFYSKTNNVTESISIKVDGDPKNAIKYKSSKMSDSVNLKVEESTPQRDFWKVNFTNGETYELKRYNDGSLSCTGPLPKKDVQWFSYKIE